MITLLEALYLAIHLVLIFYLLYIIVRVFPVLIFSKQKLPYVPINQKAAKLIAQLPEIAKAKRIVDLGCGTGTLLAAIAHINRTAELSGVEINSSLVRMAKWRSWFWRNKPKLVIGDMFDYDISKMDAIVGWWVSDFSKKLLPKLKKECQPGCVIATYMFALPEDPAFIYQAIQHGKYTLHVYTKR